MHSFKPQYPYWGYSYPYKIQPELRDNISRNTKLLIHLFALANISLNVAGGAKKAPTKQRGCRKKAGTPDSGYFIQFEPYQRAKEIYSKFIEPSGTAFFQFYQPL